MASHAPAYRATPLDVLLAAIPSLPRPILARLTNRMIERMDELDGDADNEPEEDRCEAGDDETRSGVSPGYRWCAVTTRCGSDEDAEPWRVAAFDRDQSAMRASSHVRYYRRPGVLYLRCTPGSGKFRQSANCGTFPTIESEAAMHVHLNSRKVSVADHPHTSRGSRVHMPWERS